MGALHEGHLSLIHEARRRVGGERGRVFVSIFVNPTQFDDPADYAAYPETFARDVERCREAGVDVVFAPTPEDLYPPGAQTWVEVEALAQPLCGASRPGHFRGVATVVAKLFIAARPHVAVFGEKDFQQLAVIRRMASDLGFDIEVVGAPTVREPDGLALSSRNVHLDPAARRQAVAVVGALDAAERAVAAGERSRDALLAGVRAAIARAPLARIDYAELRDPDTLAPAPERLSGQTLLALAVHFGAQGDARRAVRLIDNRVLSVPSAADGARRSEDLRENEETRS